MGGVVKTQGPLPGSLLTHPVEADAVPDTEWKYE